MEVPYQKQEEEEEEELIGLDLQTRRKSSKPQHQNKNYSFSSSESSESSDSSFEYSSLSMTNTTTPSTSTTSSNSNINVNINGVSTKNGENPKIIEDRSESELALEDLSQADDEAGFEETKIRDNYINVSQNQESNGLKNVESLFDENPNGINVTLFEKHNVENIVNKTVTTKGQNEIVETGPSQEIEPELEFDVEKVIERQKTHDLYCPNCNSCITKRVILKRRKRKFGAISANEEGLEAGSSVPGEKDTEDNKPENENKEDAEDPGAHFGAVSCFSCFSIFIPKGDGFLWWRFKPKADVPPQSEGSSLEYKDPESPPTDDGTEKSFPLWILTCCQPNHVEKPVTDNLLSNNEASSSPSHDGSVPSKSQPSIIADPGNQPQDLQLPPKSLGTANNDGFPLWFLSCCQPSSDRVKPELLPKPGPEVLTHDREPPSTISSDTPAHSTKPPTTLNTDTKLPHGSQPPVTNDQAVGTLVQDAPKPPTTSEDIGTLVEPAPKPSVSSEGGFPLWFLTCCQPSIDGNNPKPSKKLEDTVPPHLKPRPTPEDEDKVLPPHLKPQPTHEDGPTLHKPSPPTKPEADLPLSTEPKPSKPSRSEYVTVEIYEEPPTQSHQSDTGSASATNQTPLLAPRHPRAGVSGLDIIKPIVYGGLVECITSLSVISSAAGGDATTLNIVALGLANVFGGLVVLLHNVRVLKHDHSDNRYLSQLGRPDLYVLHIIVAVLSYLIFGLLSPVLYGFSFRKSDNKNYKLATLAAASLVCVTVLSIGKAYVRRPPKQYIKTIFYYLSLGFMVSGIGYVAGNLINMLLKKLGVFDSTAPVTMPPGLQAWSSY